MAMKCSLAFVVVLQLLCCCCTHSVQLVERDEHLRHSAVPLPSSAGRRHSYIRRWWERIRPDRLHGSIRLRPGPGLHLDTDVGWDFDFHGKWWTRENVCVHITERIDELPTDSHRHLAYTHTCNDTSYSQHTCTTVRTRGRRVTTTTSVYQCCHGYRRSRDHPTAGRCVKDNAGRPHATVMATLLSVGATEMLNALNVTGLLQLLIAGNHTVFAPTNEAFASFTPRSMSGWRVVRASNQLVNQLSAELRDVTAGHVVHGHVIAADLHVGGQLKLSTAADSPRNIWLNKYDVPHKQMVTANCIPLIYADVLANNGVVHVVDNVLPPADQSLQQLILSRRELSTFAKMLHTLQLDNDSQFTVFAPSNLAFDKLQPSVKDKVLSQDGCGPDIIRQHVLSGIICSQSLSDTRSVTIRNVAGHYMTLTRPPISPAAAAATARDGNGKPMRVEGAASTQSDLMASNGVLHIIDQVLFHSSVDGLVGVMKRSGEASRFVTLMELTGVTQQLQQMHDFTVFLPDDDAVHAMVGSVNGMNRDELTELVRYHIVPSRVTGSQLHDDLRLPTLSSADKQLLVKRYHSFPFSRQSRSTVQCAAVERSDVNRATVCHGVGHIIRQVLRPPAASVLAVLTGDSEYSFLVELINIARLNDLLQQLPAITFFAPTNQAFQTLPSNIVNRLMSNSYTARHVIRSHIISGYLCCAGVFDSRELFQLPVRQDNLDGWVLSLQRSGDTVRYGDVPISSCDHTADNGVVHAVNSFVPAVIERHVNPAQSRWSAAARHVLQTLLRHASRV